MRPGSWAWEEGRGWAVEAYYMFSPHRAEQGPERRGAGLRAVWGGVFDRVDEGHGGGTGLGKRERREREESGVCVGV